MNSTNNLPGSDTLKLYNISQGAFTLEDYSKSELSAQIFIEQVEVMEDVKISPVDILDCAMALRVIENFNEPQGEYDDYMVEVETGLFMSFKRWWDALDPKDTEALFEKSIASMVDYDLNRIYRKLTGKYAPEFMAA